MEALPRRCSLIQKTESALKNQRVGAGWSRCSGRSGLEIDASLCCCRPGSLLVMMEDGASIFSLTWKSSLTREEEETELKKEFLKRTRNCSVIIWLIHWRFPAASCFSHRCRERKRRLLKSRLIVNVHTSREQRGQQPAMEVKTPSGGSQEDTRPPAVSVKHGSISFWGWILSGATFASRSCSFISPLGANVSPGSKSFDVYCHSNIFKMGF